MTADPASATVDSPGGVNIPIQIDQITQPVADFKPQAVPKDFRRRPVVWRTVGRSVNRGEAQGLGG